MLVDLPGYGFAKAPRSTLEKWEALVTSYLFEREALCLVLLLIDVRREPQESDLQVTESGENDEPRPWVGGARLPLGIVALAFAVRVLPGLVD